MLYKQRLSKEQALPKIKQYCAYQERCHAEVKDKLYSYGLYKTDVEMLVSQVIEENYLDEERFAIQYAGGKFRIKQWGRKKIEHALKEKQISSYCIKRAMKEIDPAAYEKVLLLLASKKWALLKDEQHLNRQAKTRSYLLQKGFENELIAKAILTIRSK
ncbi:MAG: regulatory protein RecX [Chitinophagaceae bacterium]